MWLSEYDFISLLSPLFFFGCCSDVSVEKITCPTHIVSLGGDVLHREQAKSRSLDSTNINWLSSLRNDFSQLGALKQGAETPATAVVPLSGCQQEAAVYLHSLQ